MRAPSPSPQDVHRTAGPSGLSDGWRWRPSPRPARPVQPARRRTTVEAQSGARAAGTQPGRPCAACHGFDAARAADSPVPGLAGRPRAEIVELMLNYKNGVLPGTVMPQIAKGYSDTEILAIASWFADQK